ncbi:MAG TPA: BTAD domain-containing putative transcriptional regulator [Miltoncostaeaceae bacterium]|nr:BTAD domain-containing putative transcriptional regulator [Miltoncostaeaceae bacterium]
MAREPETRIQLCGRLSAVIEGREVVEGLPGRQGRLLFAYMAADRDRAHARDELIEALWPERAPAAAESALSALLSGLRRALGPAALAGRAELTLRLPPGAWIDLEAAEEAVHRAESAAAQGDWPRCWGPSLAAHMIARRGFMPGCDGEWIDRRRRRLEEIQTSALESYTACAIGIGGGELAVGEKAARELVALAPYREHGYALLMRVLAARGNAAEALRVYESLRATLRDELGASPGPELRALQAELLRSGSLAAPPLDGAPTHAN